jgi:hypothetical protein
VKPRASLFAALPFVHLLPGTGGLESLAYVFGAVVIVIAVLIFVMVMKGKRPRLIFGKFRFELAPQSNDTHESEPPSSEG